MAEKIVATFRIDPERKAHLQALAQKKGLTFTDNISNAIEDVVPVPLIVKDTLRDLSKGSGIHPVEILNLAFIDYMARTKTELDKFGQMLSNPFWKVGPGGFLEDHDELYLFLKQR